MYLRFNVANEPAMPKPPLAIMSDSFRAAEEMEDLQLLEHDVLKKQAHMTYIRILSMDNIVTVSALDSYAISKWYTEKQNFLNYSTFIIESCDLTKIDIWRTWNDFVSLSIATLFSSNSEMPADQPTTFANAMPILRKLVNYLQEASDDSKDENRKFIFNAIVNLTFLMVESRVLAPENASELEFFKIKAIRLEKRTQYEKRKDTAIIGDVR